MNIENQELAQDTINEIEEAINYADHAPAVDVQGEFKISVRKLEMPVRPRGVLAE
jgi:hypothetical protein